ncbi:hypothetical protein LUZ63_002308 [Rhynchospora breviuscula]|uniref:Uncharacterized protein n=1 Tax=Rhynchospora breviuscula TaxID=2022672 RepID=A0A9Q0CZU7_9POAL|nr:hypothetical protein LUZ63_002308 [Rhynchospora breviuscula]
MGRGRGKGKKTATGSDETGSGPEEVIPTQKRRGRPQKPLKEETDEEEEEEILKPELELEQKDRGEPGKIETDPKHALITSTKKAEEIAKKKRKKQAQVKEETKSDVQTIPEVVCRANGFRHSSSRRKSKPRRAAEAGIRCD